MSKESFAIVYQILQNLPEKEFLRIPIEKIDLIKKHMDNDYPKVVQINTDYSSLNLSDDIIMTMFCFYYLYIFGDTQRSEMDETLEIKESTNNIEFFENLLSDLLNPSENKKVDYNELLLNINKSKFIPKEEAPKQKEQKNTQLVEVKSLSIFTRIKNFIIRLFRK